MTAQQDRFRDELERLKARRRDWQEHPETALLDPLSWPYEARCCWTVLCRAVEEIDGAVITPQTIMTFEGPRGLFVGSPFKNPPLLLGAVFVRAYRLIPQVDDEGFSIFGPRTPPSIPFGMSPRSLAVIVSLAGAGEVPAVIPVLDERSVAFVEGWGSTARDDCLDLEVQVLPANQQPAGIGFARLVRVEQTETRRVLRRAVRKLNKVVPGLFPPPALGIKPPV